MVGLLLTPAYVGASEPREDHHHRPASYNTPDFAMPPASADPAEYPLAAGFVPADPSNYSAGGLTSYEYVVVHTMQGYYAGSISWFQNPSANVSAHYVMRAEDGEVTQMVRNADRAWHVGSENSWAIGIEHEGFVDDPAWYTWETYLSSARLTRWLCDTYEIPIDRDHVVGHVELPNQTHTDPGQYWDWDLYMALIEDLTTHRTIEGYVVDATSPCLVTATTETWLKRTLEPQEALAADEKCLLPAGTELEVLHASTDMVGHRHVAMLDLPECAGVGDLDTEGFVYAEHFSAFCDDDSSAVAGIDVILDGTIATQTDAAGHFVFEGVAPGVHDVEVGGTDWLPRVEVLDVPEHPGVRVVLGLDPAVDEDPTTGGEGSGTTGVGETTDAEPEGGVTGDPGDEPSTGGTDAGQTAPLLPGPSAEPAGCGCQSTRSTSPLGLLLLPALGLLRRRRAGPPRGTGAFRTRPLVTAPGCGMSTTRDARVLPAMQG